MQDFRTLKVWQKGHELTLAVYRTTATFPKQELYRLTSQIRRASASIPANIAEACGRAGKADFARFLQIAMGSASELEYHLILAHDLAFVSHSEYQPLQGQLVELKRMLAAFIGKLRWRFPMRTAN